MPKTTLVSADGKEITSAQIEPGKYLIADGVRIAAGGTKSQKVKK